MSIADLYRASRHQCQANLLIVRGRTLLCIVQYACVHAGSTRMCHRKPLSTEACQAHTRLSYTPVLYLPAGQDLQPAPFGALQVPGEQSCRYCPAGQLLHQFALQVQPPQ